MTRCAGATALRRVLTAGRVHVDGFLEDYGALGNACLSLYESTLESRWLTDAAWIADRDARALLVTRATALP